MVCGWLVVCGGELKKKEKKHSVFFFCLFCKGVGGSDAYRRHG